MPQSDQMLQKFIKCPNVLESEFEGETILLDVPAAMYYSLEGSAQKIWSVLSQGSSIDQLCAELIKEFQVPSLEIIERDVIAVINDLLEKKLIQASHD